MVDVVDSNVFETANAGFAQAMYEEFLRDPAAVGPEWRRLFESGVVGERPDGNGTAAGHASPSPSEPRRAVAEAIAGSPVAQAVPAGASPIKGPAAKLVANMNESLTVPTATTFRVLPVGVLEQKRKLLNGKLQAGGESGKISFTHLIAFALVQATKQHPVMGHTMVLVDGAPYRVAPEGIALGLAVDVQRKDGSRGCVVPVIKRADTMDFAAFHAAYEALVEKARTNRLMPDDFVGATMSLTNPGGLGTVASVPRLMSGQGSIIAVGAIGYPAEFSAVSEERLRDFGVSKVMTVTSTYDHRVIQGAESGAFLATVDRLLQDDQGFFELIGESLGLGEADYQLARPVPAAQPGQDTAGPVAPEMLYHVAAAMALVKAFRMHGHLAAHLDPLGTPPIGDPALNPGPLGLTPEVMAAIPSKVLRIAVPGRTLAESLPYLQATYCGTMAYEIEHISTHEERVWLRGKIESGAYRKPMAPEEQRRLLERLTEVETLEKFLHKAYLGQKRFSIEGVDMLVPMLDLIDRARGRERRARRGDRNGAPGRLNVLAHTVGRPYDTIFAEFEGGRHVEAGQLTPEGGTGDVKYHHGAEGAYRTTRTRRSPSPCRPTRAISSSWRRSWTAVRAPGRPSAAVRKRTTIPVAALPVVIHGDAGVRGPGRRGRDAQPGRPRGIPHRRHDAPHHQQPDRLHHRHARTRAPPATRPISPRASTSRSSTSTATTRRPASAPSGSRWRTGEKFQRDVLIDLRRLPAPRPQRGRRAGVHPAR